MAPESLSIVIPVFNNAEALAELVDALGRALESRAGSRELILINDGSEDGSWKTIRALAAQHDWVVGIDLMRNVGQQNALLCGVRAARHAVIVTMDDDLQHPPSEIPKLLEKLHEGWDVVYGRPDQERHGFLRNCASRFTKLALHAAMGVKAARHASAFRAFRTDLRQAFATYSGPSPALDVLLTWATTRLTAVTVRHAPPPRGRSRYTFGRLLTHALNLMTSFSVAPLQIAGLVGFAFTLFGIGLLAYVIGRYLIEGGSIPGFPFLASAIAIFSGAQLFALGIIGEYLARMHSRMMERPTYSVRDTVGMPAADRAADPS